MVAVICSSTDIQVISIIFMFVIMLVLDAMAVGLEGWIYAFLSSVLGIIFVGYLGGSNPNIVTAQTFNISDLTYYCNTTPAYPTFVLIFIAMTVVSGLITFIYYKAF